MDKLEYLRTYAVFDHPKLEELSKSSIGRDDIQPSVEPELARFLSFLIRTMNARKVLELGTSIGFSSIWLATALKDTNGHLWTIDKHERTGKEAKKNITESGLSDQITQLLGNVNTVLSRFDFQFDMVFQDCGKNTYPEVYEQTYELVRPGGVIIADDTMFSVNKGIRKNLGTYTDKYNEIVFADKRMYSVILPVGHGITLSYKKG